MLGGLWAYRRAPKYSHNDSYYIYKGNTPLDGT
jgi:hypothetical protein